jgi:hypothetical protein
VSTAAELVDAVQQRVVAIQVDGVVRGIPMITWRRGYGCAAAPCNSGAKGLRLTTTGHVHVEGRWPATPIPVHRPPDRAPDDTGATSPNLSDGSPD